MKLFFLLLFATVVYKPNSRPAGTISAPKYFRKQVPSDAILWDDGSPILWDDGSYLQWG